MGSSAFVTDLIQHKRWVAHSLRAMCDELIRRAIEHDDSKFGPEEFDLYDRLFPDLQRYAFGTPELQAVYEQLGPALEHHLSINRHHPPYFGEQGVNGMTLIDLIEMLCDWMAAAKRSQTGIEAGMLVNKKRYEIGEQLFQILENTVKEMPLP